MKILLADDDRVSREFIRRILESEPGTSVTLTVDGEDAWWALNDPSRHFDLGIFDVTMPELSGIELRERVRATPSLRQLPVILCTAANDRLTVQKASLGVDEDMLSDLIAGQLADVTAWPESVAAKGESLDFPQLAVQVNGPKGGCLSLGLRPLSHQFDRLEMVFLHELGGAHRVQFPPTSIEIADALAPLRRELAQLSGSTVKS